MTRHTDSAAHILATLIAFDTTSAKSNMALMDYIVDYLAQNGVTSELVPNETGTKASLFATIGPGDQGGIGLSGHSDVVPVEGQNWTSDPFKLVQKGERFYGRGSADMKGFIACVLALVPRFVACRPHIPLHLMFSYDEEVGCTGVRPMIEEFGRRFVVPRITIVGEPTSMNVVDAHKSIHAFETQITGLEAHSSYTHKGVNAISAAARLIGELERISHDKRAQGGGHRFDPPYTSVHVGTIAGGTALNIIPNHCRFMWEFRGLPDQDRDEIPDLLTRFGAENVLPEMQKISPECAIETRLVNEVPALLAREECEAVSLALKLAGKNETGAVSYGTEAGLFERAGSASVICGPGDIAQAHKPDEFITLAQMSECCQFLERLADHVGEADLAWM